MGSLSARAGVLQSHISRIEQGKVDLQVSSLLALARVLDLEVLPVPRKLVPAIDAIIKGEETSLSRGYTALRAAIELNRIRQTAKRLPLSGHERATTPNRAGAGQPSSERKRPSTIRAVLDELKKTNRGAEETAEMFLPVVRKLQKLRIAVAQRASESAPLRSVRPAYTLDKNEDADR